MKVWQEPGEEAEAEWSCLSKDVDWRANGGHWYKLTSTPPRYVYSIVVVRNTEGWKTSDKPFYAYGKKVDLDRVTLPEAKDLLGESLPDPWISVDWRDQLLLAAVEKGFGPVVGSVAGTTAIGVRSAIKKVLESDEGSAVPIQAQSVHHRRWDVLRRQNPVEYITGFIFGMQRRDSGDETGDAFLAGWRHGWEYAVGKAPLPTWFAQKTKNGTEGG